MSTERPYRYVSVLGSCATADAFRNDGWPAFVDAGIRVHDYVSRTGFRGLTTGALTEDEWEHTPRPYEEGEASLHWGYQMARGEIDKTHARRLLRGARTTDALVFDVVGTFTFPQLETSDGRVFLGSWELDQWFALRADVTRRWLWEQPYEAQRDAALSFLRALRDKKPTLRIAMHVAPLCTNDGVLFKPEEAILNDHVDDYRRFADSIARDVSREMSDIAILAGAEEHARARPDHPYGRYPFHYQLDYYVALRREVKRWLGLPTDTETRQPS